MDNAKAREIAELELEGCDTIDGKVSAINATITHLANEGYHVLCPVTRAPLRSVQVSEGVIQYNLR